jgi:hypothetical protein
MEQTEIGRYTVGVFQDAQWAQRGLQALARHGFPPDSLSVLAKSSPEADALIRETFGGPGEAFELRGVGPVVARGSLVGALQGPARDLARTGIGATMRRVGYQAHDGLIFETLVGRGGVLVAICSEPLAAEALGVLHAYGGGNAAIGAWTGRV